MVTFDLYLCLCVDDPDGYEGFLKRKCEMAALPRQGEDVVVAGTPVPVTSVDHNIETGIIEVNCDVENVDAALDAFIAFEKEWEYMSSRTDEEEINDTRNFRVAVAKRRERSVSSTK